MKIKLWINPKNDPKKDLIVSESFFSIMCKERAKELTCDEDTFINWLMDTHTVEEVLFFIKNEEKTSILEKEFSSYCMRAATEELISKGWYQKEVEIDSKGIAE